MITGEQAETAYTILQILECAANKAAGKETANLSIIHSIPGIKKIPYYTEVHHFRNKLVHNPADVHGLYQAFKDAPVYKVTDACAMYIGVSEEVPDLKKDIAALGEYLQQQAKYERS
jgi:hypothetical protein